MSARLPLARIHSRATRVTRQLAAAFLLVLLVIASVGGARAQSAFGDRARSTSVAAAPYVALTHDDLSAWLDGLLPAALKQNEVAGAVVIVVKDGRVLLERGYGYADVARGRPMDPARTIIRPGSISKLFIWTSVMQLVEQDRLDLDADVNRYLDFQIPAFEGRRITLRDIVTHRSGFEEQVKDIGGRRPPLPLDRFVRSHIPARIYRPGEVPAYSNYASTLAAYIVQRVSGERFEAYVAQHIFLPLRMQRSTFSQPVPATWNADMSLGYLKASGPSQYYEYIGPFPAGGLSTTADDMGRFMLAQLQLGNLDGQKILGVETARLMQAPQAAIFPQLNRMAIGFYETTRNGRRSIGHNGGTLFFHSDLHLLPRENVGIFISLNSAGTDEDSPTRVHNALFDGFMDRYYPQRPEPTDTNVPSTVAREHAKLMEGYWESSRRPGTSWFSLVNLFSALRVTADPAGRLYIPFPARGVVRWTEVAPFLWRSGDGDQIQALVRAGEPLMIGIGVAPPAALVRVPWWRSPGWLLPSAVVSLFTVFLYGIGWPLNAGLRHLYGVSPRVDGKERGRLVTSVLVLALVAAAIGYPVTLARFAGDFENLSSANDGMIVALQASTATLLVAATMSVTLQARRMWRDGSRWPRMALEPIVLVALGALWWIAIAFNLVNLNLTY